MNNPSTKKKQSIPALSEGLIFNCGRLDLMLAIDRAEFIKDKQVRASALECVLRAFEQGSQK